MKKMKVLYAGLWHAWDDFVTYYRITEGTKYITLVFSTRLAVWPDCNREYYRILKENFAGPDQMLNDAWNGRIPLYKKE